jgi:hypothetical protein
MSIPDDRFLIIAGIVGLALLLLAVGLIAAVRGRNKTTINESPIDSTPAPSWVKNIAGAAGKTLTGAAPIVSASAEAIVVLRDAVSNEWLVEVNGMRYQNLKDIHDDKAADKEMAEMAREERDTLQAEIASLEGKLKIQLLPKDAADDRSAILEVRAGTGGDEAALFAADLFRMYSRYAEMQGWKVELISASETLGCTTIARAPLAVRVRVAGTVRTLTLRSRAQVPALEVDLYDGSETLTLVFLGRRAIRGITPGRRLVAGGRVTRRGSSLVMYNPTYELLPDA